MPWCGSAGGRLPANGKVACSILCQTTFVGCGPGFCWGLAGGNGWMFLSLFLPPFPSLQK